MRLWEMRKMKNMSVSYDSCKQVRRLTSSVALMALLFSLVLTALAYAQTPPANGLNQDFVQQIVDVVRLQEQGEAAALDGLREINWQLAASGKNFAVGKIQFFTIGEQRPDTGCSNLKLGGFPVMNDEMPMGTT
jgi:hypothetical protein